jgi:transcriptional antiterminator RfaH
MPSESAVVVRRTSSEPQIFPEDLLELSPCDASGRRWWVLYTKPRNEKAVARQLHAMGVPFYLPLVLKRGLCRRRPITSLVPLFPNYLFLFGTNDERVRSLSTNRIVRNFPAVDESQLNFDLRQVRRLIASHAPLTVESRLDCGRRVRVRHGSLAGLEGTVISRQGHTRLVISVKFLGQGASVVIEDCMVEPLD